MLQSKHARLTSSLMICRAYRYQVFLQLINTTHQGFPNSEQTHLTQVSIVTFKYFFTYLLSDAQHPKMRISWAAIIFKCFKLPNPFYSFYLTWDNINSYTTLYHSVQYHTTLYYTILYTAVWHLDACVIISLILP